jgi:hypothetical protein
VLSALTVNAIAEPLLPQERVWAGGRLPPTVKRNVSLLAPGTRLGLGAAKIERATWTVTGGVELPGAAAILMRPVRFPGASDDGFTETATPTGVVPPEGLTDNQLPALSALTVNAIAVPLLPKWRVWGGGGFPPTVKRNVSSFTPNDRLLGSSLATLNRRPEVHKTVPASVVLTPHSAPPPHQPGSKDNVSEVGAPTG